VVQLNRRYQHLVAEESTRNKGKFSQGSNKDIQDLPFHAQRQNTGLRQNVNIAQRRTIV